MDPKLRQKEFPQLADFIYLDHTGTTLFAKSQLEKFTLDITTNLYGNPHTHSYSSQLTSDVIDHVRSRILHHFNTTPDKHCVIFTSGCTGALKLLAESFPWYPGTSSSHPRHAASEHDQSSGESVFCYLQDDHTSAVGMREVAVSRGARSVCLSPLQANTEFSKRPKSFPQCNGVVSGPSHLFIYPGQSNFSGKKYPLDWTSKCKNNYLDEVLCCHGNWFVALDAAALVSTSPLDLSDCDADFISLSFYKLFGFPTGIGALIVKKEAVSLLKKDYFGGGTVAAYSSTDPFYAPRKMPHEWFEDGTLPFLDIIALRHGFDALDSLGGGMTAISQHTFTLAKYTFEALSQMQHSNGKPLAQCYCDNEFKDIHQQGPIITFNLLRPSGEFIGYAEFQKVASLYNIQLRTGCFCNIGACQYYFGLGNEEIKANFEAGHVCGDDIDLLNGKPTGSVRISFGYMSLKSDADTFLKFVRECFVDCQTRGSGESLERAVSIQMTNGLQEMIVSDNTALKKEARSRLSKICLYPVKSCAALKVDQWELGPQGLKYDRLWMIVNEAGVFISQKRNPKMCLIKPTINLKEGLLTLHADGMEPINLPLDAEPEDTILEIKSVCADRCQTFDCGDAVSDWVTAVLGQRCRLHRQDLSYARRRRTEHSEMRGASKMSLANSDQYLLISTQSSQDLLSCLPGHQLDNLMDRFRANFIISGETEAYEEDTWKRIRIGENVFQVTQACVRCKMITIDQMDASETKETFTKLADRREGKIRFGILMKRIDNQSAGTRIVVGTDVEVLE
ncbi:Molybdenum cofactor sulfurase [Holothuria leucospilota]|uniref:Molybdenum cofactor sulfurase n=1 Tax=Holothuria leucospilota TaxID=206669 RepID=A0A9Q1BZZ5_HOLLE|nr:Molybdenum cofactor sulfurase [Holothuria leucospilota]